MATVGVTNVEAAPGAQKLQPATRANGLMTPETSVEPDEGRITYEIARRAAAEAAENQLLPSQSTSPITSSQEDGVPSAAANPAGDSQAASEEGVPDSQTSLHKKSAPTEEQLQEAQRVLSLSSTTIDGCHQILRLGNTSPTSKEGMSVLMNNFRKLGTFLHSDYILGDEAKKAFNMVLDAAQKLGVDKDELIEIRSWNGQDKMWPVTQDSLGQWMTGDESMDTTDSEPEIPKPAGFHETAYKLATPYVGRLLDNPSDNEALGELQAINGNIKEQNKQNGLSEDVCLIQINQILKLFESAQPFIPRLRKTHQDLDAMMNYMGLNNSLKNFCQTYHYPEDWFMRVPEEEHPEPPVEISASQSGFTDSSTTSRAEESTSAQKGASNVRADLTIGGPQGEKSTSAQKGTSNVRADLTIGGPQDENSSSVRSRPSAIPSALIIGGEDPGWVSEDGIEKAIKGCIAVGNGYRLLLSQPGKDGYDKSELVAASTFGKGTAQSYLAMPGSRNIKLGKLEDLQNIKSRKMRFSNVASVRRNPENEPEDGWATMPITCAQLTPLDSLEVSDADPWFTRSTIIQVWGQKLTDKGLRAYRDLVGQEHPRPASRKIRRNPTKGGRRRRVASDDEDEDSYSLFQHSEYDNSEDELEQDQGEEDAWVAKRRNQAAWKNILENENVDVEVEKEMLKARLQVLEKAAQYGRRGSAKRGKSLPTQRQRGATYRIR